MHTKARTTSKIKDKLRSCIKYTSPLKPKVSQVNLTRKLAIPKGPNWPPIPPLKNRLNNSSGDISSSAHVGPCCADPPDDLAKPLKGDCPEELAPNLLSGSPPNLSYRALLSESDST